MWRRPVNFHNNWKVTDDGQVPIGKEQEGSPGKFANNPKSLDFHRQRYEIIIIEYA